MAALVVLVLLVAVSWVRAAGGYPALTGRVVDAANVLPESDRTALASKLANLETTSGVQLVVATVPGLDGREIEPYANDLFRFWKLGDAKANNGALLLVAPNEHRVRIEVGYGLEGTLTDALAKIVITNAMVPRFKANDYAGGLARGVDDIVTILTTDPSEWQKRPTLRAGDEPDGPLAGVLPIVLVIAFLILFIYLQRQTRPGGLVFLPTGGGSGSGWGGGGGFSGGGFSGGGGSSGGGGASGSW